MKFSFRRGDPQGVTRELAWACFSTNLVFPGSGSLLGGRKIGYPQVVLTLAGFLLTTVFGIKFVIWGVQHWSELRNPEGDPIETLTALWAACRWALLGMLLFGVAWVWALLTSCGIMRRVRQNPESATPPRK